MSFKAILDYKMSVYSIICIALTALVLMYLKWTASPQPMRVIAGDGEDYYSYLVSVFIHKQVQVDPSQWYAVPTAGGTVNLHSLGVALMELPFFLGGLLMAKLTGAEVNGFSGPFQMAVQLAAFVYLLAGLAYTARFLAARGFTDTVIALSLVCVFFGTTLIVYAVHEPSMSHIYSFALIAAFLFHTNRLLKTYSAKGLYILAFLFGLIILVRPVNVLVILALPALASSYEQLRGFVKNSLKHPKHLVAALLIGTGVLMIQGLMWFLQTGHWLQWSYQGNGFYFTNPHAFQMLFGFNSGLFVYTPLCLVALAGFWFIYKRSRFQALNLLLFLVVITYVFSAYWGWTYFDGISIRTYVDYFALLALLLAGLFTALKNSWQRSASAIVLGSCLFLNLTFCYQYYAGILPGAGMTREKFDAIFMKTSDAYKNVLGGCNDLQPYSKQQPLAPVFSYAEDFEKAQPSQVARCGDHSFYVFSGNEYGVSYTSPALGFRSNKIHVKVDLDRLDFSGTDSDGALLVLSLDGADGQQKLFQAFKLNDVPSSGTCVWKPCHYGITACASFEPDDKVSVFVWNKARGKLGIDNFKLELYNHNYLN